ncbi:hypothetical protein BH09BAC1_BH09BAC1_24190 [soil metagenome]
MGHKTTKHIIMKTTLIILVLGMASISAYAQKYFTKTANINFFSATKMENIDAKSSQVTSIIDFSTGNIAFKMQVKTFQFEKALMQEHFNEKYLETDKYPESSFKGQIEHYNPIDFTKDGEYKVTVKGDLNIHGVTQTYTTPAIITVKGGKVSATAKFPVKLADHKVSIPGAVKDNINEVVEITINADYAVLNK